MSPDVAFVILNKLCDNIVKACPQLIIAQKQLDSVNICWLFQYTSLFDALHRFRFHARDAESAICIYDAMILPYDKQKVSLASLLNTPTRSDDTIVFCISIDQFTVDTSSSMSLPNIDKKTVHAGSSNMMSQSWSSIGRIRFTDYVNSTKSFKSFKVQGCKRKQVMTNSQANEAEYSVTRCDDDDDDIAHKPAAVNVSFRLQDLFNLVESDDANDALDHQ